MPLNTKDAVKNINTVENILSSVKSAQLLDQIPQQDYEEITFKCILRRRLDAYTEAWTKFIREQEGAEREEEDQEFVEQALKGLTISVHALKRASRTTSQVHFFLDFLKVEINQLNYVNKHDKRQAEA